jgi:hypothetical protein
MRDCGIHCPKRHPAYLQTTSSDEALGELKKYELPFPPLLSNSPTMDTSILYQKLLS